MPLKGQLSLMVEDALREAFPTEAELAAMCFHATDVRLNDLVGEGQPGKSRVYNLLQAADPLGLTNRLLEGAVRENPGNAQLRAAVERVVPGFVPPETAAFELANRSQFDLKNLDDIYWETVQPTPEATKRLIGFGVAYSDEPFISLIRERLVGHLGRNTINRDPYVLDHKRSPPAQVHKAIQDAKPTLRAKHNLYVVRADTADDEMIAELWRQVSATYPGPLDSYLVLIIATSTPRAIFPPAVTPLPVPSFRYPHLLDWARQMVKQLRRANADWEPVDDWAKLWSDRLYSRSLDENVLNVRSVYDNLQIDIEFLKEDESGFRLSLKQKD